MLRYPALLIVTKSTGVDIGIILTPPLCVFCLKVQIAERTSEVMELKRSLAQALRDKEQLQEVKQLHHNILRELQMQVHKW